jgi:membrane carboxypeptidase/penicillin-binding protein
MEMPDGMVIRRIDRETGCPARAGQPNAIFEYFREGQVPTCEAPDAEPDIFNDVSGIDPAEDDADAEEPLF